MHVLHFVILGKSLTRSHLLFFKVSSSFIKQARIVGFCSHSMLSLRKLSLKWKCRRKLFLNCAHLHDCLASVWCSDELTLQVAPTTYECYREFSLLLGTLARSTDCFIIIFTSSPLGRFVCSWEKDRAEGWAINIFGSIIDKQWRLRNWWPCSVLHGLSTAGSGLRPSIFEPAS